jgi:hypothetical protein
MTYPLEWPIGEPCPVGGSPIIQDRFAAIASASAAYGGR